MTVRYMPFLAAAVLLAAAPFRFAVAEESTGADNSAELAKKLSNPVADLISVPMKLDWNTGMGPANADQEIYVVQPVIPITLNEDWNIISRTILPYINQESPVAGGSSVSGLGDTLQSLFFSPKSPSSSGWIWGVGPALSIPTATKDELGTGKWSLGPTAVFLKQDSGWTYGVLANHVWSIAGESDRSGVSSTFVQPFLSYTTRTFTTIGLNTESTYDWKSSQWTVPINLTVSQLIRIGTQPVSFLFGVREYAASPTGGPDWGLRFQVTLLYPKKVDRT